MIAEQVESYAATRGPHRSGQLRLTQLRAIERLCRPGGTTIETGCGASTIVFSGISRQHTVFAIDDRQHENSSVQFAMECPLYRPDVVKFVFGPTQLTLPAHTFGTPLDAALIDGPHAFPFAELEYYFIYPRLATGGILIIDDVHIPTLFQLYRFLREEKMFSFVEKHDNTAFFRRTDAPLFDPLGDGWQLQEFNRRRFPVEGRDEKVARFFPKRLTQLFPPSLRSAIKTKLFLSGGG